MEVSDAKMIAAVTVYYDEYKINNISDIQDLFYKASKITTYINDSSYLKNELEVISNFYNQLISSYNEFDIAFEMLKKELYDQNKSEEENLGFVKLIIGNLLSYKTEKTLELRKLIAEVFEISLNKQNANIS